MTTINLDPDFTPFSSDALVFENMTFAGGEPHIKIQQPSDVPKEVIVTHRIRSFNDLGLLCLAVDALRRMGVQDISAVLPYFPAARQDRLMIKGEPLSVKVYADLVNNLLLKDVIVFDPHSEVTPALLIHCTAISNHQFIKEIIKIVGSNVVLVSPDGGALKKIYKLSEFLGGIPVVQASKMRDVKTGNLTGFKVFADDLDGKNCLVVDDICDGGGTFLGLAETLKQKNAGSLFLAVSHGIFSKGLDDLAAHFSKIFTTNAFRDLSHPSLTQINLDHGLLS